MISRRTVVAAGGALIATPAIRRAGAQALKRVRMLLNTSFSGPQAFIFLAIDNGHVAREGLTLELTTGGGAYTAAPRMAGGGYDVGYGDINALIEVSARDPANAPVAVFVVFNASPSTIAVDPSGPIRTPRDLEGKTLIGHASDVALRTFGAFCRRNGVDGSKVRVSGDGGGMLGMVDSVIGSTSLHGVFAYVSTLDAAIAAGNRDPDKTVRHLRYADLVPDLYGSTLMVAPRFLREEQAIVAGLVRAFNAGIVDLARNPEAGLDAVMRRVPGGRRDVERLRLERTLEIEMAHKEGARIGIGDVDEARFAQSIALIAETNRLPRLPAAREVLVRDFLPPLDSRVRSLAR